jgi:pimeloyl-ACP methyl ester carboxylesterase
LARSAATVLLLLLAGGAGTTLSAQSAGAAPGLKSGYLGTGEDKVYYEAAGAGPAIVFIHDGVLPSEEWDGQQTNRPPAGRAPVVAAATGENAVEQRHARRGHATVRRFCRQMAASTYWK